MKFRRPQKRTLQWDGWTSGDMMTSRSYAGKNVNELTALKYSVLWRSVNLIADAVSSMPPRAFTEDKQGRLQAADLPQWVRSPHSDPGISRTLIWHQLLVSVMIHGNAYAQIYRRPSDGVPIGFYPIHPTRVFCNWLDPLYPGVNRIYRILGGPDLTSRDILHIQGLTLPGEPKGLSVIGQMREALGLGLTLEEFGARYFSQGSMAKVVIKVPKTLNEEQSRDIVKTYERFHKGPGNWHRPAVLSGPPGSDIVNISIPPGDAQFLETREFQALDVARWFGVPPHRVGIVTKQSSWGSGLAEENMMLLQTVFRRYIMMLETTFTSYAPGPEGMGVQIRLDDSALERGTIQQQVETWFKAVNGQIATPNEARAKLGLPPIDGGDKLISFVSNKGTDRVTQPGSQQPNPAQDKAASEGADQTNPQTSDAGGANAAS